MPFAEIYKAYQAKVARKGVDVSRVDAVLVWISGESFEELEAQMAAGDTVEQVVGRWRLPEAAAMITGKICGVVVQEVQDPLMYKIRCADKLIDEVARGWELSRVLRDS